MTTFGNEKGFTLVELAIVMIIIGLLIGGVLKGQELINNAQVSATVSQIKGIEGAVSTFRDRYSAFPGDMTNTVARIPNCGACADGSGNLRLASTPSTAPAGEALQFWVQLNAAEMLSGYEGVANTVIGEGLVPADVGGTYWVGYTGNALASSANAATARAGHYLLINDNTGVTGFTPSPMAQIDRKLDDGVADAGSVIGGGAAGCFDGNGVWQEAGEQAVCAAYIRIQ